MEIGILQADKLNLECWMEASSMGKPLYEKFGFQSLTEITFDTDAPGTSDEWRRYAHEMTPQSVFAMWRPRAKHRTDAQGEIQMPWVLGTES
jgi:hypothetical protein